MSAEANGSQEAVYFVAPGHEKSPWGCGGELQCAKALISLAGIEDLVQPECLVQAIDPKDCDSGVRCGAVTAAQPLMVRRWEVQAG